MEDTRNKHAPADEEEVNTVAKQIDEFNREFDSQTTPEGDLIAAEKLGIVKQTYNDGRPRIVKPTPQKESDEAVQKNHRREQEWKQEVKEWESMPTIQKIFTNKRKPPPTPYVNPTVAGIKG